MPIQYSLQRLFISILLVSCGLGYFTWVNKLIDAANDWSVMPYILTAHPITGAMCGAGIGLLLKHPVWGSVIGCACGVCYIIMY